ncbi:MAG TPA: hemerythrin domain-containing protein [Elusimicrobiota bacterium]|nr:hemerythrin domain-containing protein [Elusimicrobiota bacterium]
MLASFLSTDHDRLDTLLSQSASHPQAYESFRRGLLKHVGMEEMILLPAVKRLTGAPLALAAKIRLDHGALTALMIPSPTPAVLAAVRAILEEHNRLEEQPGGLYEQCEQALGAEAPKVLEALKNAPDIPPAAHVDSPRALASVKRALEAAGYGALDLT